MVQDPIQENVAQVSTLVNNLGSLKGVGNNVVIAKTWILIDHIWGLYYAYNTHYKRFLIELFYFN